MSSALRSRASSRRCTAVAGSGRIRDDGSTVPPQGPSCTTRCIKTAGGAGSVRTSPQRSASQCAVARRARQGAANWPAASRPQPQWAVPELCQTGRRRGPASSRRILDLQNCGSYRRARQLLGRRHVTESDRCRWPRRGNAFLDEGTGAGGIQSRGLLRLAGHALLSRMGRAVTTTVVIHRHILNRVAVNGSSRMHGRACVEMADDAFGAHAVRVHEGEQHHGHPQHAQRARR